MADPTLDAYLKALGFDQQTDLANTQANQQRGQVQATYDLAVPQLQFQTGQQLRNTTGDALGRGIYDSGEYQRNMADVNTQAGQRQAQLDLSKDQGLEDIGMSLARQLSGIDVGRNTATYNYNQFADASAAAKASMAAQLAAIQNDPLGQYLSQVIGQRQNGGFASSALF